MSSSQESGSSAKGKSVRKCPNCRNRMSGSDKDKHVICTDCRGKCCSLSSRCDVCVTWTDDEMASYLRHQESLKRKRESKKRKREELDPLDYVDLCIRGEGESGSAGVGESGSELPDNPIPAV